MHYSTISRNLRRRTSIVLGKCPNAPKMDNEQQQVRVRKNYGKLYQKLLNDCDLIMDDKKYFKLAGNDIFLNLCFYSTDSAAVRPKVNFQCETKFEPKMMIWIAISSKSISDIYVHKSKPAVNQEAYLKECIDKRQLLQILFEWKLFVSV